MPYQPSLEAFVRAWALRILREEGPMKPSLLLEKLSLRLGELDPSLISAPDYVLLKWITSSPTVFIEEESAKICLKSREEKEEVLRLLKREGVVTPQEVAMRLGMDLAEARKVLRSLEGEGLLFSVSVHQPSRPPRRVLLFSLPSEGHVVHRYVKKVISSILPLKEEVEVPGGVVDLSMKGMWIEVVTSKLSREKWKKMKEKLVPLRGKKFVVVYSPSSQDMRWILKKAREVFKGTDVRVVSFFDLPFGQR